MTIYVWNFASAETVREYATIGLGIALLII